MIENYYIKTNDSTRMSIEIKVYQNSVMLEEVSPEQDILIKKVGKETSRKERYGVSKERKFL